MICKNCGAEIGEGKFCPSCGTPVENVDEVVEETQPTEEATGETVVTEEAATTAEAVPVMDTTSNEEVADNKQVTSTEKMNNVFASVKEKFLALSKNVQIGIVAGALLIVIIIIIAACSGGGSRFQFQEYEGGNYQQASAYVLFNTEGVNVESDEIISDVYVSADGSTTAFCDSEGTLFIIGKKGPSKVADDVANAVISTCGNTIAYVKDADDYVGELFLYTVSKDKSVRIDKEVYAENLVLSPDGKSIAYVGNCEVENGWFSYEVTGDLFLSKKGNDGEKLYSDAIPVAITNNGKNVFYVKDSEKLYVNDEKIASDITSGTFAFNLNNTELIYNKDGNSYYYTLKMEDSIKLKGESFYSLLAPEDTIIKYMSADEYSVYTYGIDTFNKSVLSIGGSVYYMSEKGDSVERITSDLRSYKMTEDGESLLYVDYSGDLMYIKNVNKSLMADPLGDDLEADYFVTSDDLKKVYYVSDEELFYLNKDKGVRISDDVESVVYSDKYGVVYFTSEDELFYAKTKAKTKERVMGEYVVGVYEIGNEVLFEYAEDDDTYDYSYHKMTGKTKSEEIVEADLGK